MLPPGVPKFCPAQSTPVAVGRTLVEEEDDEEKYDEESTVDDAVTVDELVVSVTVEAVLEEELVSEDDTRSVRLKLLNGVWEELSFSDDVSEEPDGFMVEDDGALFDEASSLKLTELDKVWLDAALEKKPSLKLEEPVDCDRKPYEEPSKLKEVEGA